MKRYFIIFLFFIILSFIYLLIVRNFGKAYANHIGFSNKELVCRCLGEIEEEFNPAYDPPVYKLCEGLELPFSCVEETIPDYYPAK